MGRRILRSHGRREAEFNGHQLRGDDFYTQYSFAEQRSEVTPVTGQQMRTSTGHRTTKDWLVLFRKYDPARRR